jgi:hypothetical protein
MSIRSLVLGVTALVVLAAVPVCAEDKPPLPAPVPEHGQLAFFEGTWKCTGKTEESPFGPAHATQATVRVHKDLGGFWRVGRYEEKKTAENPSPMAFEFLWGYDTAAKAWTLDGFDVFGNRSHETSPGWKVNALVFAGESMGGGPSTPVRDTFTKKSDSVLEHAGEMQVDGKWLALDRETCKK